MAPVSHQGYDASFHHVTCIGPGSSIFRKPALRSEVSSLPFRPFWIFRICLIDIDWFGVKSLPQASPWQSNRRHLLHQALLAGRFCFDPLSNLSYSFDGTDNQQGPLPFFQARFGNLEAFLCLPAVVFTEGKKKRSWLSGLEATAI